MWTNICLVRSLNSKLQCIVVVLQVKSLALPSVEISYSRAPRLRDNILKYYTYWALQRCIACICVCVFLLLSAFVSMGMPSLVLVQMLPLMLHRLLVAHMAPIVASAIYSHWLNATIHLPVCLCVCACVPRFYSFAHAANDDRAADADCCLLTTSYLPVRFCPSSLAAVIAGLSAASMQCPLAVPFACSTCHMLHVYTCV